MKKRCVITGLGLICPVGNHTNECWDNLIHGRSGIAPVTSVNTEGCISHLGGEVHCETLPAPEYDRSVRLCIQAAQEAITDASLPKEDIKKAGIVIGSCVGGVVSIDRFYTAQREGNEDNADVKKLSASSIANSAAAYLGLNGVTSNIVNACAAGTMSIAHACDLICSGEGEIFLAGGTDAFSSLAYSGFNALHALSEEACSPLNKSNGITLGEGAGILVVEDYEHAKKRGAQIYCEVSGYGVTSDAYHITAPHPQGEGQMNAIKKAMACAQIRPDEIAYINAHGTGTAKNDIAEFLSIHTMFDGCGLSVSSTKSMTGHCLGAAGAIEAVITVKTLSENLIPPTIGYSDEDLTALAEKAGEIDFVANTPRVKQVNTAMSNSFAFGGTDASIIFSKLVHEVPDSPKKAVYITGAGSICSSADGESSVYAPLDNNALNERGVKMGFYRKLDRFSQLQLISGIDALKDAGLEITPENETRAGIIIGTADGPATEITTFQQTVCEKGTAAGSAFSFPNTVYNAAGGYLSIFTKAKGYCATIANGAQAGLQALSYAYEVLQKGNEDFILTAGTDENSKNITELYSRMGLAGDYILGEASACLALETKESAQKRSAKPLAELAGFGCTHCAKPEGETAALKEAIRKAYLMADVAPQDIVLSFGCKGSVHAPQEEAEILSALAPNARMVELIEKTGDCRAASGSMAVIEAAKAVADEGAKAVLIIAAGCGSFTAVVLRQVGV